MPIKASVVRELEKLEPELRQVLITLFEEVERQIGETVTKKEFNELVGVVRELGEKVSELAEAQKRTEEELQKLVVEHRKTREQLGGLTHTVGYVFEDRAYVGLVPLLKEDLGIEVIDGLKRDYIEVGKGRYIEVNIIGKGLKNGKEIWIVGEAKTQLKKKDVNLFVKHLERIKPFLRGEVVPVIVTYQASPPVRRYAEEKRVKLYFSYQFPL